MKLLTIFSEIYDFCKYQKGKELSDTEVKKSIRERSIHESEVITIFVWYFFSGYKTFKDYYTKHVKVYMKEEFPNAPSYTRFLELKNNAFMPILLYALTRNQNEAYEGLSIADSFPLEVCHNRRIHNHKTMKNLAKRGHTSLGFFFGLKLHLVINVYGEICSFAITPGNVSDNNGDILSFLTKFLRGKMYGDKGYIVHQDLYKKLYDHGVQLITKVRKNMKSRLYTLFDAFMLSKRGTIESVGNLLKNTHNLEHSRHRSVVGFFVHVFSCLVAYSFRDTKPSIFSNNPSLI